MKQLRQKSRYKKRGTSTVRRNVLRLGFLGLFLAWCSNLWGSTQVSARSDLLVGTVPTLGDGTLSFLASFAWDKEGGLERCTGTRIAANAILTSATCAERMPTLIGIQSGPKIDLAKKGVFFEVEKRIHPSFHWVAPQKNGEAPYAKANIAVLKLGSEIFPHSRLAEVDFAKVSIGSKKWIAGYNCISPSSPSQDDDGTLKFRETQTWVFPNFKHVSESVRNEINTWTILVPGTQWRVGDHKTCDSADGSPLFSHDGAFRIQGVLSSHMGKIDSYSRVDFESGIGEWILAQLL